MVSWYETALCSEAYALDDSEEGLRNMYRIYRNPGVNLEILVRLALTVVVGITGLVLGARFWSYIR